MAQDIVEAEESKSITVTEGLTAAELRCRRPRHLLSHRMVETMLSISQVGPVRIRVTLAPDPINIAAATFIQIEHANLTWQRGKWESTSTIEQSQRKISLQVPTATIMCKHASSTDTAPLLVDHFS